MWTRLTSSSTVAWLVAHWPWSRSRRFARSLRFKGFEETVALGSSHARRVLPARLLNHGSVCYSGGVGDDISFDLDLLSRYGCSVYAFDPTPGAKEAIAKGGQHDGFHFFPYGLWSEDVELRFNAPTSNAVDWSVTESRGPAEIAAPGRSLTSLMAELGHERIDLLKLDIEGAEYQVLDTVLAAPLDVKAICVEFHKTPSIAPMKRMARRLQTAGYAAVHVDGFDVTFVRCGGSQTPLTR